MTVIDLYDCEREDADGFVDHTKIDWQRVRRTRFSCHQRFHYAYPGPIRDLRHNLVVVPTGRYGDQWLREHSVMVTPDATDPRVRDDEFGNRVFEFDVGDVDGEIAFEVSTTVERAARPRPPHVARAEADRYLSPTALTASDERIEETARELSAASRTARELAKRIDDWVASVMRYAAGVTGVQTTASEALALGEGLCQDFAHVMIAVCRAARLPARYVSGHMPGEGGSHAWVEAMLPCETGSGLRAVSFDPTNRHKPNLGYTTVAVGRDYADVPPTSGSFTAPYGGHLSFTKRAGLTFVEMTDGEVIEGG
jgi:transglutaminase-like putative cysteine protease